MIKKVIGRNPNFEIVFVKESDDCWVATVPSNLLGEYYIDLYAYDMAGNVAYMSKALFTVDVNNICIHLLKDEYKLDSQFNDEIKTDLQFLCDFQCLFIENFEIDVSLMNDFECSIKEVIPCLASV